MLIDAGRSVLLVSDMQEKLLPAIHDHGTLMDSVSWLVRAAQRIGVPVAAVEQYPKGLGRLASPIRDLLPEAAVAQKTHFSCVAAQCLGELPGADRAQVVIAGIETHVCVLQEGVRIVSREMVVFEWLGDASTPLFKDVSREFLKG